MEEKEKRQDPISFLPEEPMNYEPKKKKKRKKHKHVHEDPFKDVETITVPSKTVTEYDLEPEDLEPCVDPEVKIKVENIDDDNEFDTSYVQEDHQNQDTDGLMVPLPMVEQLPPSVVLTFEKVIKSENVKTEDIKSEVVKKESDTAKHMCDVCHIVFRTARNLQIHQNKVHNKHKKMFIHACKDCDKKYSIKSSLTQHRKKHHSSRAVPKDNTEQACDICALIFKGAWRVRLHKLRHHGLFQDEYRYKCRQCSMRYESKESLKAHVGRKHRKKKNVQVQWYQCPICPHVYNNRDTYVRHIQRKHHQKDQKIKPELMENMLEANKPGDIQCKECPMVFTSAKYLTLHMRRNHNDKTAELENMSVIKKSGDIPCQECPMVFTTVTYLKLHMRRKHNAELEEFRLNCALCKLSFDKVESLKRHIKRKHIGRVHCEVCGKYFESQSAFDKHFHEQSVHECSICSLIFISQGALSKHMRYIHKVDTGTKSSFCTICKKGFFNDRQLRAHRLKVHLNVSYKCQFCEKTLKTRDSFRAHLNKKHAGKFPDTKGKHACSVCPEKFQTEHQLCKHIQEAHDTTEIVIKSENGEMERETQNEVHNSFQCNKCETSCPTFNELKKHYEQEHYQTEKTQCQVCGELIPVVDLPKHMKTAHPADQYLSCNFCDYKAKTKTSLTQHMLRHQGAQTLQCEYPECRYNSFYKQAMEKHKKKHEQIGTKLQCAHCSFQCMDKYILRYHEVGHTTGKKKFQCDKCQYATCSPGNFVQHKLKHSTEKKFKCEYCWFATKYNCSLRYHVKKKHCDLIEPPKPESS